MRRTWIVVTTIMMFSPGAEAQERPAFHVAVFPDNRTVSLAIAGRSFPPIGNTTSRSTWTSPNARRAGQSSSSTTARTPSGSDARNPQP